MDELTAFLRKRLEADERAAREASRKRTPRWRIWLRRLLRREPDRVRPVGRPDAARVLADVAAKRAMLDTIAALALDSPSFAALLTAEMATAWRGHPAYRADWDPAVQDR